MNFALKLKLKKIERSVLELLNPKYRELQNKYQYVKAPEINDTGKNPIISAHNIRCY